MVLSVLFESSANPNAVSLICVGAAGTKRAISASTFSSKTNKSAALKYLSANESPKTSTGL